jgi:CRP/FNR family transcriptional regulator, cyclic AMP receptor protein
MSFIEPIGYLASALVLATFCMRSMVALRCVAIASNLAFIGYGLLANLDPVLVLHLLLLPLNVLQLARSDVNALRRTDPQSKTNITDIRNCAAAPHLQQPEESS